MALQVSRFYKLPSTFGVTRLLLQDTLARSRSSRRHLPVTSIAAAVRPYSSNRRDQKPNQKVVVVGLTNPFIWIRTRIYYFLIRAYFDAEFSIEEFTEGAKQAFCHVSRLLSKCQFSALEGLVAQDLIGKLEEKCNLLPSNYKSALYAEPEEIMFTTPSDVGIYYDDDGRKFVSILMRFWYLTSARLPDDSLEGTKIFKVAIGNVEGETKRLLTANYEFQREFTKGVEPDWTITRIEHSKLLD
ncbi:m-AAA protease-interacting protein 1, mitochondrial isoform X1 [Synchiropus splendidus]|uniref:m-AAA protease-interacting protein 1, mitochondrial isoform X1 n=1 Tax=Synchiropus splendidus TaxID=270530 RepID=UPI00237DDF46|nr:m-AAA protease-interacting protein 1, mitochondrial isoform X1 [Synchiropus splendidus]